MIQPELHNNEEQRLKELASYAILDTGADQDFDHITALAAKICNTPISLISFVDQKRQWFKSKLGVTITETDRKFSFCASAITMPNDEIFIVEDSRTDNRFFNNPLVTNDPNIIFYAGIPLRSNNGFLLGTLCVIDHQPRQLDMNQIQSLQLLGKQVMCLMELKKDHELLKDKVAVSTKRNEELWKFAFVAAHDLKSPLNRISAMAEVFVEDYNHMVDEEGKNILDHIVNSSQKLRSFIDDLFMYNKVDHLVQREKSIVDLQELIQASEELYIHQVKDLKIEVSNQVKELYVNQPILEIILKNIISNAIRFNDKEKVRVKVVVSENEFEYNFLIEDNGPGIEKQNQDKIFELLHVLKKYDRFGISGHGIGLAMVKKLVESMNGIITITSKTAEGTLFTFSIKK